MLPYWLLFGFFAYGALVGQGRVAFPTSKSTMWLLTGSIIIAIMIGVRWQVGGDWNAYLIMYRLASHRSLGDLAALGDPGYMFLNWIAQRVGAGIWLVNLFCGSIFAWGLLKLAKIQPYPELAMLIAIPYLVIVVAMGLSRQAVAIGFLMAGLAHLTRTGSFGRLIVYITIASLFHKTAVVALPMAMIGSKSGRVLNFTLIIAVTVLLFDFLLKSQLDRLVQGYIDTSLTSQGASTRVAMNLIPAAVCLIFGNNLGFTPLEKRIWRNFSVLAFALLVMLFLVPSSTVIDRLGLYVTPLQLVVFSRMPLLLRSPLSAKVIMITYSSAILYVWLTYAVNAPEWLPYQARITGF